jgi:ATP-dependent RNA helicase DeaD
MGTFTKYAIDPDILKAITEMGYIKPSEIQSQALPILLDYKGDFIGQAQTGTGKTAAYGIPLIQQIDLSVNRVQAIILAPTRELAVQITEELNRIAQYKKIKIISVYGGQPIYIQLKLLKLGAHIVVGTPGRVIDHLHRGSLDLSKIRHFILDEADEMLDRGFLEEIDSILTHAPEERQIWMFSATLSGPIRSIANKFMSDPEEIRIKHQTATIESTEELYYVVKEQHKLEALCRLIDHAPEMYAIIFCQTRVQTAEIAEQLVLKGFKAESLHGDMNQAQRDHVMRKFKSKGVRLLVATDVAARGIDVNNLTHVINYSLPMESDSYIHRIGRTGRAGKSGIAITLINPNESHKIRRLEGNTRKRLTKSKIPGLREIMTARMLSAIGEFEKVLERPGQFDQYFGQWEKALQQFDRNDIARGFVTLLCREILEKYEDDKELNAPDSSSSFRDDRKPGRGYTSQTSLTIDVGAKNNVQIGALVGLICNTAGIENRNIGKIRIQDRITEFEVDSDFAPQVVKKMSGIFFAGKKINIQFADENIRDVKRFMKKPLRNDDGDQKRGRRKPR